MTHLIEFGYPERFVTEQVGHSYASTTAIYTSVSNDFKTKTLKAALCPRLRHPGGTMTAGAVVTMQWHLRQVMADEGHVSDHRSGRAAARTRHRAVPRQMVHRIVTKPPQRINIDLLAALCDILDCTPSDLLELHVEEQRQAPAVNDGGPGIGELRPIRARVRRPDGVQE